MSEIVTSASLREDITWARDGMVAAAAWAKDAAVDKPRAEIAYETAFAKAFVRHRDAGEAENTAKQRAMIETTVERQKFYELKEGLMVAKAELHAWGSLFDAYRSISFTASNEMKFGVEVGA